MKKYIKYNNILYFSVYTFYILITLNVSLLQ